MKGSNVLGNVVYAGMHWKASGPDPFSLGIDIAVNEAGHAAPLPSGSDQPDNAWREFLSLVPHFECSDAMLTRYYWYRWYGLRLNALPAGQQVMLKLTLPEKANLYKPLVDRWYHWTSDDQGLRLHQRSSQ